MELVDSLSRIESSKICAAVFGDPVDTVSAYFQRKWLIKIAVSEKMDREEKFVNVLVLIFKNRLTCEYNELVINWTLHHFLNFSNILLDKNGEILKNCTYGLTIIHNAEASLVHDRMKLFPGVAPISRPVDRSSLGLNKKNLIRAATPHDIL